MSRGSQPLYMSEKPSIDAERERFSAWVVDSMPFDANVGMVKHSIKTAAAWVAWQAAVEAERERCAKLIERGVDLAGLSARPVLQIYTADLLTAIAEMIRKGTA